jgi:UDP-N-acetylmuramate: L-alanyl-gamma-D-glutamyl-meso-diaminopimelate ligase
MRIHLIAIGGAAMHNIALALQQNGHSVSGSDDEIYPPASMRLQAAGLLPTSIGWDPDRINRTIDVLILGMHAKQDNPELLRALEIGIPVFSYPAFIYQHARLKTRLVVAGSHGKTTTTSMVMHVLRKAGLDFDYLVGAQLQGFETMVKLSDAPVMVIEGDEYLSSALEPVSKMVLYRPNHLAVTGIAWDHVNVFPTLEQYENQFEQLMDSVSPGGTVSWFKDDLRLESIVRKLDPSKSIKTIDYSGFESTTCNGKTWIRRAGKEDQEISFFGDHNLQNAKAAACLCAQIGICEDDFVKSIADFSGASKRLQALLETNRNSIWLDFAHAPSKVIATVKAVKNLHRHRSLVACLELHTYSSLSKNFLPQYRHTLEAAEIAVVYYSPHTLQMKKLPKLEPEFIASAFNHPNLQVFTDVESLSAYLRQVHQPDCNLLLMTSGTLDGLSIQDLINFWSIS